VNKQTLETRFPGVYAVGDVNGVGTAKAGVFAEGAARVVAAGIVARIHGGESSELYKGQGSCYIEFGHEQVARVDVDFLSGPKPTGTYHTASEALVAEKARFGASRLARWFGQTPAESR
jgi:sulfide:quinone oxidoreductase